MEISYKKDGNRNFLIIRSEGLKENDYRLQMVLNNKINGMIPMSIRNINNQKEIYYCTTSMVSMESVYAQKSLSADELCGLIKDIKTLSENIKAYLMDLNSIIFDMEFVFINRQNGKYKFCYLPGEVGSFQNNLKNFFEKLLEFIDYKDKKGVLIAYGIQQITTRNDFTIHELEDHIINNMEEFKTPQFREQQEHESIESVCKSESNGWNVEKKNKWKSIVTFFKGKHRYITEDETTLLDIEQYTSSYILRGIDKDISIELMPEVLPCVVGKSKKRSDFLIDCPEISRTHAKIMKNESGYWIEDLKSTNGTFVNGRKLGAYEKRQINIGDCIKIANLEFVVESNLAR